jgi:hypothetical protein
MELTDTEFEKIYYLEYDDSDGTNYLEDANEDQTKPIILSIVDSINLSDLYWDEESKLYTLANNIYKKTRVELDKLDFLSKCWPIVCRYDWSSARIDDAIHLFLLTGSQNTILMKRIEINWPILHKILLTNRDKCLKIWKSL